MPNKDKNDASKLSESTVSSEIVFQGNLLQVQVDRVVLPNGKKTKREVVNHPGGVVILPVIEDKLSGEKQVILVKQYRQPIKKAIWELPAGKIEDGEYPLDCAKRELNEETGFGAGTWKREIDLFTSPGYSSEILSLFVATEIEQLNPEDRYTAPEEELLIYKIFSISKILEMVHCGTIRDGKTLAGLLFMIMDNYDT